MSSVVAAHWRCSISFQIKDLRNLHAPFSMSTYLLSCSCGEQVPVEVGQAGGKVTCRCGTQLDVPALRQLRHLPQVKVAEAPSGRGWGARQGIIAASAIVVAAALAWSLWSWKTDPAHAVFDSAQRMSAVEEQLKTPAGAWDSWVEFYKPLAEHGFPLFQASNIAQIEQQLAERRFLRGMLWSVAAIFAAIAAAAIFWPNAEKKRGRGGDKETGRR